MATAVVLGATGEVGKRALLAALAHPGFATVHSLGRSAPKHVDASTPGFSKHVHTTLDYDRLWQGNQAEVDKLRRLRAGAVLIAHGTTKAIAGSADEFRKIDKEYVLAAAKAARVAGTDQVLVYCSSFGASTTSRFLYPSSKAFTEQGLAALGYSRVVILRPGYLQVPGGRGSGRYLESMFSGAIMTIPSLVSSSVAAPTPAVGRAMVLAATESQEKLARLGFGHAEDLDGKPVWMVPNCDILRNNK